MKSHVAVLCSLAARAEQPRRVGALKLDVKEPTLRRLERRAQREGLSVDELATGLLEEAAEQDPDGFIGASTGGPLFAEHVDEALADEGFAKLRS